jgi:hypothetical protein
MVIVLLKYTHSLVFLKGDCNSASKSHKRNHLPVCDYPDETRQIQRPQEARKVVEKVDSDGAEEGSIGDDASWHDGDWSEESLPDDEGRDK